MLDFLISYEHKNNFWLYNKISNFLIVKKIKLILKKNGYLPKFVVVFN